MLFLCVFVLIFNIVFCDVIVNTNKGQIQGQLAKDGSYSTFFGIPYALVDVNNPFGGIFLHAEAGMHSVDRGLTLLSGPYVPDVDTLVSIFWLRFGTFFGKLELLSVTNNYRRYIMKDGTLDIIDLPRESLRHVISGCSHLANGEYLHRHNQVARIIHQQLALKYSFVVKKVPYYRYISEGVLENDLATFYWGRSIITDWIIVANKVIKNSLDYPKFTTIFNASDTTIQCPQTQTVLPVGGILQCLTLNIYVPKSASTNKTVPVFVWIYGGGFFMGSAGLYDGKYLVKHDIIVVAINYRLGPYGFLCLDDPAVPGNQGLKDQITALRWLKENIGAFGGDNQKITIAGESYGGGSVDLHMFSKYETLFNKAIIQSGGAEVRALYYKPDYQAAMKLSAYFGRNTTNNKDAISFLAKVDPVELTKAAVNLSMILRVCPEKKFKNVQNFLTHDPFHLSNPERIRNTDILLGYTSKEDFSSFANKTDDFYKNSSSIFYDRLKEAFNFNEHELVDLAKIVQTFYLGNKTFTKDAMLDLADFSSDCILNHAAESSVNRFIRQGAKKVYKYLFSYVGGSPYKDIPGVGAYHTEELQYLFEWFNASATFTDEQILMRDRMTKMWSNFVKYGNPTPEVTTLLPVPWVPVTNDVSRPYMNIDVTMSMLDRVYHERIAFWDLFWHSYWRKAKVAVKRKHC